VCNGFVFVFVFAQKAFANSLFYFRSCPIHFHLFVDDIGRGVMEKVTYSCCRCCRRRRQSLVGWLLALLA